MTKPQLFLQTGNKKSSGFAGLCRRSFCGAAAMLLFAAGTVVAQQRDKVFDVSITRPTPAPAYATQFSGAELMKVHPTSLVKALESLVPALVDLDSQEQYGSNPNATPVFDTYGQKYLSTSTYEGKNKIALIIDGHSETMDRLIDFDIKRVESVTYLKDASAAAIYGVRAGKGAIVITTAKPADGSINLIYNFDGEFQSADTHTFNFMNASEKLALENAAGLYDNDKELYEQRLKAGNTDWAKLPLESVFSHRHRISLEGSDETLAYRGTVYSNMGANGVMKGSSRKAYGASAYIGYNAGIVKISNEISIDKINANESNYGSLYQWGAINPYYEAVDGRGDAYENLGEGSATAQYSPLYEATLNSFDKTENLRVNNSLLMSVDLYDGLKAFGSFTYTNDTYKNSVFISPMSIYFDDLTADEADQKGHYSIAHRRAITFQEQLGVNYAYSCGDTKVSAVLGGEMFSFADKQAAYTGMGMSSDNMNYVSFAQKFYGLPFGGQTDEHVLSGFASVNYSYADKLFIDLAGRLDKSSALAPENRTAGSYSVAARYDLTQEYFLQDVEWLPALNITASYGSAASYQFNYADVNATYYYDIDNPYLDALGDDYRGYGNGLVSLVGNNLYNPALKWQADKHFNVGLNGVVGPVSFGVSYYNILSKNLMAIDSADPSLGYSYQYTNAGEIRNAGIEYNLNINIVKTNNGFFRLNFLTAGVANKNTLVAAPGFMNDENVLSPLVANNAADGIYAYSDENLTELEYMGSAAPKLKGSFGLSADYANFDFSILLGYSLGGKVYNAYEQLMIDMPDATSNTFKRAEAGTGAGVVAPLSKYVYDRNVLSLSSMRLGYNFPEDVVSGLGMKGLKVSATCSNLFHRSSVDNYMRGSIYPYASSAILSLQAIF